MPTYDWTAWVCERMGAETAEVAERIQTLWSGYGEILRLQLTGADVDTVVLKRVDPPTRARHRRGWTTSRSHERKLRSYQVELCWYRDWAPRCSDVDSV